MKRVLFLAVAWMTFSGFAVKDNFTLCPQQPSTPASVQYMGDPRVDGYGWVLMLDNEKKIVVPVNLPQDYQQDGLPVYIDYEETGNYYPCRCINPPAEIRITDITVAVR